MKKTAYDSSAVDTYINELNSREAEITRAIRIQNFKREVPAKVFLWCGYAIPIIIIILMLGIAISQARSFEVIEKTVIEDTTPNFEDKTASFSSDQVIDIEEILNEEPTFPSGVGPEIETKVVVRNYVIFDTIPFNGEVIEEIIVGRKYESPGSESSKSWCYIEKLVNSGIKPSIYLVHVDGNERTPSILTKETADSFGVSLAELKRAQKKCSI